MDVCKQLFKKPDVLIYSKKQGCLTMTEEICPRCGYKEVGLVKKEMLSKGGYKRYFRCPRCNHTWQKDD